jgi:hypothetical protein
MLHRRVAKYNLCPYSLEIADMKSSTYSSIFKNVGNQQFILETGCGQRRSATDILYRGKSNSQTTTFLLKFYNYISMLATQPYAATE